MLVQCLFCSSQVQLIHVHGHYQCPKCGTNAMPCCDGDNCDTNLQLQVLQPDKADQQVNRLDELNRS
jgi:hypothetical protein